MKNSKLLVAVLFLQGLLLVGQWTGSGPLSTAHAQIPDAGSQQQQIIEQLKSIDAKMDTLTAVLKSGEVKVTLPKPEK